MKIVLKALYISNQTHIEVNITEYIPGTLWETKTEFIHSSPKGNWNYLEFTNDEQVSFVKFLDLMVEENIEVLKLKIKLLLEENIQNNFREIVNALSMVDPTFIAPETNPRCHWQNQLLLDICNGSVYYVIATCKNRRRLKRFLNFMLSLT